MNEPTLTQKLQAIHRNLCTVRNDLQEIVDDLPTVSVGWRLRYIPNALTTALMALYGEMQEIENPNTEEL